MMTIRIVILTILLALPFYRTTSQTKDLTTEQWREDLTFLQEKLDITFSVLPAQRQRVEVMLTKLQQALPEMDDVAIMAEMGKIVAAVGDGHTELNLSQRATGWHSIPLAFHFFGEDLHILVASEKYKALLGKKVFRFDGTTTAETFEKLKPFMAHDNDQEFKYAAPGYFRVPTLLHHIGITEHPDRVTLELEDGTSIEVKALSAEEFALTNWQRANNTTDSQQPLFVQNQSDYYWYRYLEESNTVYFKFNRVNNQKGKPSVRTFLKDMFKEIDRLRPEKLVIDLRHNNGGNYHRSEPLLEAILDRPWLNQKGKLFVINGPRTFSAAAVTTIFLKRDANGIVVGEPSRSRPNGADNMENATMPNSNLSFSYTDKVKDHWTELGDAPYIDVDVPLENTFEDYMNGRDRILEYILKQ